MPGTTVGIPANSELIFSERLRRQMNKGTRPEGPNKKWTALELATKSGFDERTVRNWLQGLNLPKEVDTLLDTFFGKNPALQDEREELRKIYEEAISLKSAHGQQQPSQPGSVAVTAGTEGDVRAIINSNDLFGTSRSMAFWLYTSETILNQLRDSKALIGSKAGSSCSIQFLLQHPEAKSDRDAAKSVGAGLDKLADLAAAVAPGVSISVRFYSEHPSFRMFSFLKNADERRFGITGIYYHDPKSRLRKFVGADDNVHFVSDGSDGSATIFHEHCLSRFRLRWSELPAATKAVIFDFDGVLVDSMPVYVLAWNEALKEQGCIFEPDEMKREVYAREGEKKAITARDLFEKKKGRVPEEDAITNMIETVERVHRNNIKFLPFDGARELLNDLKARGMRLALVTGSSQASVEAIREFDSAGILAQFDTFVTGSEIDHDGKPLRGKPHPAPYERAVEKLGIDKRHCVVVENAPFGVRSAKAAGLVCLGVLGSSPLPPAALTEAGADAVADDLLDLRRYLMWVDSNEPIGRLLSWLSLMHDPTKIIQMA